MKKQKNRESNEESHVTNQFILIRAFFLVFVQKMQKSAMNVSLNKNLSMKLKTPFRARNIVTNLQRPRAISFI